VKNVGSGRRSISPLREHFLRSSPTNGAALRQQGNNAKT
jgi:hypothetical protein